MLLPYFYYHTVTKSKLTEDKTFLQICTKTRKFIRMPELIQVSKRNRKILSYMQCIVSKQNHLKGVICYSTKDVKMHLT